MIKEWFLLDSITNSQKGPLSSEAIENMLYKNSGVNSSTMIWKNGLDVWKKISEIDLFESIITFLNVQWFYVDSSDGQQKGPVSSRFLIFDTYF